jgi:hypothetical protein
VPELSRFFKIIVQMYFSDNDQHHKPHIHVKYNEYEAAIAIDGELLEGSLPERQLRLVQAWMVIHEDELYRDWNKVVQRQSADKIDPLK